MCGAVYFWEHSSHSNRSCVLQSFGIGTPHLRRDRDSHRHPRPFDDDEASGQRDRHEIQQSLRRSDRTASLIMRVMGVERPGSGQRADRSGREDAGDRSEAIRASGEDSWRRTERKSRDSRRNAEQGRHTHVDAP